MVYAYTHYKPITQMNQPTLSVLVVSSQRQYDGTLHSPKRYVRVVKDGDLRDYLNDRRTFIEKKYGEIDVGQRQRLLFLIRLGNALTKKDIVAINQTVEWYVDSYVSVDSDEDAREHSFQEESWLLHINRNPREALASLCIEWLRKVGLVIWWPKNDNRIHVGLFCQDIDTAFFTLWLSRLNQARGFAICLRCGQPFERSRRTQKFCTQRCQEAYAVAKHRRTKRGQ